MRGRLGLVCPVRVWVRVFPPADGPSVEKPGPVAGAAEGVGAGVLSVRGSGAGSGWGLVPVEARVGVPPADGCVRRW